MDDEGEVLGAFSISMERGKNMLKKVASVRMLHQPHDNLNIVSYLLQKRVCPFISPSLSFTFANDIPGINTVAVICVFANVIIVLLLRVSLTMMKISLALDAC